MKKIQNRVTRLATSLSFPYLIIGLYKATTMPILVAINEETVVSKKFNIERMKDE